MRSSNNARAGGHDARAQHLAFGGARIHDQAAILHRDHAIHLHLPGFDVDADVGHLHAGDSLIDEAFLRCVARKILALLGDRLRAELGARLFPAHALVGISFLLDASVDGFELIGGDAHDGREQIENLAERVDRGFARGDGNAADGGRSARSAGRRKIGVAEADRHLAEFEAEGFGRDHRDHRAGRGAEVLTAQVDRDAAVGLNSHAALAVVAEAAPGVDADAEAALDGTARLYRGARGRISTTRSCPRALSSCAL